MRHWRIGIIGGGPGGLMTTYCLQKRTLAPHSVTLFEASDRLGGKILTGRFSSLPIRYEAGAAELYDYSAVGPDPLRELIAELGLPVAPMEGNKVIATGRSWSAASYAALDEFDRRARSWMSPRGFYGNDRQSFELEPDPLGAQRFDSMLATIPDSSVKNYIETLVHSDLATEPALTSAEYGLQNYLMNDPAYLKLYTIPGGIERLTNELAARIAADVRYRQEVIRVERTTSGLLGVTTRCGSEEFDFVVVALPNASLPGIEWGGEDLAEAMRRHHRFYDYPAHYLRVTILFERPFWRDCFTESYFMLEAFGGCCVYDESTRNGDGAAGVLGWLLGGEPARELCERPDDELIAMMLASLPETLRPDRGLFVEGRVHRWQNAVNGMPSGYPARKLEVRHCPEPVRHSHLLVVGDYLFDSTLNGVLDSAEFVAETLGVEMEHRMPA
jgi:monoamine oxidase